jgi:hypothetical protein
MLTAFDAVCPRPIFFDDAPFLSCLGEHKEGFLAGEVILPDAIALTPPPSHPPTVRVRLAGAVCWRARHGLSAAHRQAADTDMELAAGGSEGDDLLPAWCH